MKKLALHFVWLAGILISAMLSCKVAATGNAQDSAIGVSPKILFLNYTIRQDSLQQVQVALLNKIVTEGTIKSIPEKTTFQAGDLKCIALNKKREPLSSIIIANPLHKSMEYEDADGHLTRKEVWLDSTIFSVRMQLPATAKFVAIERLDTSGNTTLLLTEIDQ